MGGTFEENFDLASLICTMVLPLERLGSQRASKFEFVLNLKIAKALGLDVPR